LNRLYVLCDLEGASGIGPENREAMAYGSELWHREGRRCITSDVQAVCEAANAFGIDEIVLNDSHDYGHQKPNVLVGELPRNVRLVRRPHLPGKARHTVRGEPFGIVIVGQHAMYGGGGFAPHTIQSPPVGEVTINGVKVGEIGIELALFMGAPLLAIIGEKNAVDEAKALCPDVVGIPVKWLEADWFPPPEETHAVIRRGAFEALRLRHEATGLDLRPPFRFTLRPAEGYYFDPEKKIFMRSLTRFVFRRCRGSLTGEVASWEAKTIIGGLYALESARMFLARRR